MYGNTAQLRLRTPADLLPQSCSLKNLKYCAAVASASWLTDVAYPLRVHKVFLRSPNFILGQNLSLLSLAELCAAA